MNTQRILLTTFLLCAIPLTSARGQTETPSAIPAATPLLPMVEKEADVRTSVVKIHTKSRYPDWARPWRKQETSESTGTGVVINWKDKTYILTNAHVVAYATQVDVQGYQQADKVPAKVVAYAQAIDLALVQIKDDAQAVAFLKDRPAVPLADDLPAVKDTVSAFGYPVGGEELSITRGIVSRIEVAGYNLGTVGLRVQVDAALNPGNSGGPAIVNGKVAGLVFSGIPDSQKIGYVIPITEVKLFLKDAEDGAYDGKWRLLPHQCDMQTLENKALRAKLNLTPKQTGMLVNPDGNAKDLAPLAPWDVLLAVGEHKVANDGNCKINENLRGHWIYFVDELAQARATAIGSSIPVTILRGGKEMELSLPVNHHVNALFPRLSESNAFPRYFIYGPLCFSQATHEIASGLSEKHASFLSAQHSPLLTRLTDIAENPNEELVIISSQFFDHPSTKDYNDPIYRTIKAINGNPITSLRNLAQTLRDLKDEFVVITFHEHPTETLVFSRTEMESSTKQILEDNGIRYRTSADLKDAFKDENE